MKMYAFIAGLGRMRLLHVVLQESAACMQMRICISMCLAEQLSANTT